MSYTGQPLKRFEDPRLVTGRGAFVDDIHLPDMLYAAVLRSPHAHARIRAIDVSAARHLPGVATVLTGEDTEGVLKDVPTRAMAGDWLVDEMKPVEQPVLAKRKVCYVGQPVAIVVAQDRYLARDALERLQVDYQVLPPLLDPMAAMQEDAIPIHQAVGTNLGLRVSHEGGDLAAAFTQADRIIRQRYHVQRLAPVPLETRGVAAHYQPEQDLLTVWNSSQAPHRVRRYLAPLLKRLESRVRVIAADVGGGFGEKGCMFPEDVAVPYLSLILGRPVKWVADRQENMLTFHGRGHTVDVEAAVKYDGSILGMGVRIVADLGAYFLLSTPWVPFLASHRIAGPYRTPAMRVEVLGVFTNKPPTGAYRGAGGPEAAFCMERTVDLIAQELNLDPAAVRRKNFISPDAFPYTTPTGVTYDSGDYERGFERALELAEYGRWRERAQHPQGSEGPLIGVGLATVVKASGAYGDYRTDSAQVKIDPTGHITAYTGVSPHGQGSGTTFAQIVADELGVNPAAVEVRHGDTAIFPTGGGTGASRGLTVGGSALFSVLQEVRHKLSRLAAHQLHCSAEDIAFQGGRVFDRHKPKQTIPFADLAAAAYDEATLPPGVAAGLEFSGTYTLPGNPYAFGAHVAVVEVDRESGDVRIVRYVAVHDCGRIINPKLVEGQMYGGIAQGLGQALTEGAVYTPDGQPLTGSLLDYAVPKAAELPPLILETMETRSPTNPLGVKGIGELPTVATPAAIANAVMDALSSVGVRHIDTPLTAEKIWRALHARVGG
ncbi:MAG: xanthine dehydrogenase family protein molybdopterin-binding subunit [Candidatus Entotheonellia bacterium]